MEGTVSVYPLCIGCGTIEFSYQRKKGVLTVFSFLFPKRIIRPLLQKLPLWVTPGPKATIKNSSIDGWVLGSQFIPSESSSQFSAASRRVQWSQQPVGETWLCWSQSLSFLNKHFPFWNNYLTIYRKHQLLQSKSLIIWKGISLKLFSSFFKAAVSPLLPGFMCLWTALSKAHVQLTLK